MIPKRNSTLFNKGVPTTGAAYTPMGIHLKDSSKKSLLGYDNPYHQDGGSPFANHKSDDEEEKIARSEIAGQRFSTQSKDSQGFKKMPLI